MRSENKIDDIFYLMRCKTKTEKMKKHTPTSRDLFIMILLIFPFVFSCNNDDEPEGVKLYQGSWNGTYSGVADNGTWMVEIDETGNITGAATSTVSSVDYGLTGTVNSEGDFLATTGSAASGTVFTGVLTATNGQGTWENAQSGLSGTWSGNKQGNPGNGISN